MKWNELQLVFQTATDVECGLIWIHISSFDNSASSNESYHTSSSLSSKTEQSTATGSTRSLTSISLGKETLSNASAYDLTTALQSQSFAQSDQSDSSPKVVSEVRDMLQFLQREGRGRDLLSALTVTGTTSLPLSADTFGGLQQDSTDDDDSSHALWVSTQIPFSEQDDPSDPHEYLLP